LNGPFGLFYTVMDASARSNLPPGVQSTRLPSWIIPGTRRTTQLPYRPDLLIIEGLTPNFVLQHNMYDPAVLGPIQRRCKIHILEVGYTADASFTTSLGKKYFQHVLLCRALVSAGWTLSTGSAGHLAGSTPPPFHIMLLGMTGHIFKPCSATLQSLGNHQSQTVALMKKLVAHTVRSAHNIICLRRTQEWKPP
jgi:hypothetical protein